MENEQASVVRLGQMYYKITRLATLRCSGARSRPGPKCEIPPKCHKTVYQCYTSVSVDDGVLPIFASQSSKKPKKLNQISHKHKEEI
jgi:hypothetical protein